MCESRKIPEDEEFPNVWDWLEHAHYYKFHDPRTNKTYDAWETRVSPEPNYNDHYYF